MIIFDIQRGQSITLKAKMVDVAGLATLSVNAPMSNLAGDAKIDVAQPWLQ